MANTYTANYNLTKPEVGAATNQWGGLINSNLDTIDTEIKARETAITNAATTANAALPKDGSAAMTGMLTLPSNISPTNNFHATTKKYVDDKFMPFAGGAFAGLVTLHAQPTDASADLAVSTVKYVKDKVAAAEIAAGAGIPLAGNPTAMTGYLTLINSPPLSNYHAAPKNYVDSGDNAATAVANTKLPRDGSQAMTGPLSLAGNPTSDLHAAPKQYVDNNFVSKAGGNMNGLLVLSGDPVNGNGAATKNYIDNNFVSKNGNVSLGGYLTLNSDPTSVMHAVTLNYLTANYVPKSGGSFNGNVTIPNLTISGSTVTATGAAISCYSLTASFDITLSSDFRLKEDIRTIENAVDITKQLRGVSYVRKDTGKLGIGVVAQEVEQVLPQLVATDANGMKSVAYANMVGILIEAVKELSARVAELEAR
jgi:hypothetical protein